MLVEDAKKLDVDMDLATMKNVIQMVSNYMPIIIETFLYDAISQKNLIRVFQDTLNEFISNPQGNEFRIFILTLLLVDLDVKENFDILKQNLKYLKLRPLRFAVVSKLLLLTIQYSDNAFLKSKIKILVDELKNDFDGFQQLNEKIERRTVVDANKALVQKHSREKDYKK